MDNHGGRPLSDDVSTARGVLAEVAQLRKEVVFIRAQERAAADLLEVTPEYQALLGVRFLLKDAQARLLQKETEARECIVREWDGKAKKGQGWGIRVMRRINYHVSEAESWCRTNFPAALTLNTKVFEKAAAELPGAPVEIVEEVTATIDSNLEAI